jgi:hypothetical protein
MTKEHQKTYHIGGIATHVYGLENTHFAESVDVVLLLHGRTRTWQDNVPWAHRIIELSKSSKSPRPLLVVTFDARNHGARIVDDKMNQAWNEGNETHGQDMYSTMIGTSQDASFLITFLPAFLFPDGKTRFENVLCAGVSLGGHETYLLLSNGEDLGCNRFSRKLTVLQTNASKPV